jgi:hypothetical protein
VAIPRIAETFSHNDMPCEIRQSTFGVCVVLLCGNIILYEQPSNLTKEQARLLIDGYLAGHKAAQDEIRQAVARKTQHTIFQRFQRGLYAKT